jgi:hypothetical protein
MVSAPDLVNHITNMQIVRFDSRKKSMNLEMEMECLDHTSRIRAPPHHTVSRRNHITPLLWSVMLPCKWDNISFVHTQDGDPDPARVRSLEASDPTKKCQKFPAVFSWKGKRPKKCPESRDELN